MAIRTDVSIAWGESPRVLTVAAPSTEITIQDIVDTCRYHEELLQNLDNPHLIDAAGKEFLGGTTYVGITATLQNAVVAFEARSGPDWVLCTISGGNLVAVNEDGDIIDPRTPTAFVSVDRTASASATLQEQTALQHSSFEGGVTVDFSSPHSGTNFPAGTSMMPLNNWADAHSVAVENGFYTFYILGSVNISSGYDFSDFHFIGSSREKTTITIEDAASVSNCEYYDCTIQGVLDGNSVLRECKVENINYIQGTMDRCILEGSQIILLGDAVLLDCYSGNPDEGTPQIDCGGSGKTLVLKNYNGLIELINKSGTDPVDIDLNSGRVILQPTVADGVVTVRGVGIVDDYTTNGAVVDISDLINPAVITTQVWDHSTEGHMQAGTFGGELANGFRVIARALGLVQENYFLDQTAYTTSGTGQKLMTSAIIRTYTDAASVGTGSNILGKYQVTATYAGDELSTYKVERMTTTTTTSTTTI